MQNSGKNIYILIYSFINSGQIFLLFCYNDRLTISKIHCFFCFFAIIFDLAIRVAQSLLFIELVICISITITIVFFFSSFFYGKIHRNEKGIWTGDHVPGTYCNKNVYDCDRR